MSVGIIIVVLLQILFAVIKCANSNGYLQDGVINAYSNDHVRKCVPVAIAPSECKNLVYNFTSMPNLLGHETQSEAQAQLQTFQSLISYGCSSKAVFFLCSVYLPMCDPNTNYLIGPCRPLCEEVRDSCISIMATFNLKWPTNLNCSQFPKRNVEGSMCMEGPKSNKKSSKTNSNRNCKRMNAKQSFIFINRTRKCVPKCHANILFNNEHKYIAKIWLGVLAILCFVSCGFTLSTFLINTDRFKYPERPVIFLAISYCIYSISNFIRLLNDRESSACNKDPVSGEYILTQEGLDNTICAIIFLLNYFFTISSHLWWVILTLGWLLAAGFKWSEEAIYERSGYFHLAAWLISSLLTVSVLVMRCVDADELLGLCSVGQQNTVALLIFVILPNSTFLCAGCLFLLIGLIALVRVRKQVKNGGLKTDKLEVLMVRIGLFSILFLIPSSIVLGCHIFEYLSRESWLETGVKPNVEIFMLKIFMSSVVGITSGVWVWSLKTLDSWRWFCCVKICRRKSSKQLLIERKSPIKSCGNAKGLLMHNGENNELIDGTVPGSHNPGEWISSPTGSKLQMQDFSSSGYTHPHISSSLGGDTLGGIGKTSGVINV